MEREVIDTLIVSDVHLGSELCQARTLLKVLQRFSFRRLILNGDIFDSHKPAKRLKKSHFDVLRHISGLMKPENRCEVVWIPGNHDPNIAQILKWLYGEDVVIYDEYIWEYGRERHLAIHGDQFDTFYQRNWWFTEFATWVYTIAQLYAPRWFCTFLKRNAKHYVRATTLVAEGALAHARHKKARYIFCGHTHFPTHVDRGNAGSHYFNSGSWTESVCTYITVSECSIMVRAFAEDGIELEPLHVFPLRSIISAAG